MEEPERLHGRLLSNSQRGLNRDILVTEVMRPVLREKFPTCSPLMPMFSINIAVLCSGGNPGSMNRLAFLPKNMN